MGSRSELAGRWVVALIIRMLLNKVNYGPDVNWYRPLSEGFFSLYWFCGPKFSSSGCAPSRGSTDRGRISPLLVSRYCVGA
jgi:hypothetical protein